MRTHPYLLSWTASLAAISLLGQLAAAELKIEQAGEQFLFGGKSNVVSVSIQNESASDQTVDLQYRLFQASSATIMPVGEKAAFKTIIPAGQKTTVPVGLDVPVVRGISAFQLKLYEGGQEVGWVPLRVCPTNLLAEIKRKAGDLALWESEAVLREVFEQNGIETHEIAPEFTGKLAIVRLASKEQEADSRRAVQQAPAGASLLFIVSPGVTGFEKLLPVQFARAGTRPSAIVQDWFVPDLSSHALSQLRLLRVAEVLLEPELVKTPSSGKINVK